jgi:hypothetical protein
LVERTLLYNRFDEKKQCMLHINSTDDTALLTVPGLSVCVVVDRNEGYKVVVGAAAAVDVVVVPAYVSVLAQVGLIVGPVSSVHYAL